jgi:hypothetical protein
MRISWPDGTSVELLFAGKGRARSQVQIQHEKLLDQAAATRIKQYWAERLRALESLEVRAASS